MRASKIYYIISNYLDLGVNDTERRIGLYEDITNGYSGSVKTVYDSFISYNEIRYMAKNKTKKEIDMCFEIDNE